MKFVVNQIKQFECFVEKKYSMLKYLSKFFLFFFFFCSRNILIKKKKRQQNKTEMQHQIGIFIQGIEILASLSYWSWRNAVSGNLPSKSGTGALSTNSDYSWWLRERGWRKPTRVVKNPKVRDNDNTFHLEFHFKIIPCQWQESAEKQDLSSDVLAHMPEPSR